MPISKINLFWKNENNRKTLWNANKLIQHICHLRYIWSSRRLGWNIFSRVYKLKKAGALSRETAKTVEELGLSKFEIREIERIAHWTLSKSIKEIIDEKGKKRYYVTEKQLPLFSVV